MESVLPLAGEPKIRVINDAASQIIVVVPSETAIGEPFDVKVAVRDRHGNVAYDYDGYVSVEIGGASVVIRTFTILMTKLR